MPMDEAGAAIRRALAAFAALTSGSGSRWVLGGSAGLALRGARLEAAPRDLDIYADASAVPLLHARLTPRSTDGPAWDETGNYRSLLSHYDWEGVQIELVGDFEVVVPGSRYRTEVDAFLYGHGDDWVDGESGLSVRLMPLGHELIFNLLRGRRDRALETARLMRADPDAHLPVLERLTARHALSADTLRELRRLVADGEGGESDAR
ncbi:hypothetical protein [Cohnella sp. JJ-181]|uniref:hypothetical protein n=1 Tax=Cohnella rhizoplanae TaxID=2974897 RepID=UPI0022FF8D03|nr:hypothetical protein [Cohnella sp. JJ-181]CAI6058245.1 hypothetical protein COHCIP112018_01768 [Cohnella sp. JJ-181]